MSFVLIVNALNAFVLPSADGACDAERIERLAAVRRCDPRRRDARVRRALHARPRGRLRPIGPPQAVRRLRSRRSVAEQLELELERAASGAQRRLRARRACRARSASIICSDFNVANWRERDAILIYLKHKYARVFNKDLPYQRKR